MQFNVLLALRAGIAHRSMRGRNARPLKVTAFLFANGRPWDASISAKERASSSRFLMAHGTS